MHTVFALLCFVVVIHWLIFPYPSGLLHWHCGNLTIAPVPAKQPWYIWINTSCEFIMNDCITTTKQSTTKPCAYFLGYTVSRQTKLDFCFWQRLVGLTHRYVNAASHNLSSIKQLYQLSRINNASDKHGFHFIGITWKLCQNTETNNPDAALWTRDDIFWRQNVSIFTQPQSPRISIVWPYSEFLLYSCTHRVVHV